MYILFSLTAGNFTNLQLLSDYLVMCTRCLYLSPFHLSEIEPVVAIQQHAPFDQHKLSRNQIKALVDAKFELTYRWVQKDLMNLDHGMYFLTNHNNPDVLYVLSWKLRISLRNLRLILLRKACVAMCTVAEPIFCLTIIRKSYLKIRPCTSTKNRVMSYSFKIFNNVIFKVLYYRKFKVISGDR